ncbi:RHS repeat-associated core domain-containing protein [Burkholderia ubonensis]|uniref:RHS repeat-associated core domain-containing protein n=1 Tax=Burkholderia ubonensis TaxID=101571 RepID=UPI00075C62D2|nr:RHS repeat-associated core domain-containing protein [Burkholderia ubonensis]KVT52572.1 type IV secretion protein Rhs [Burkholderia ubonensis]
MALPAVKHLDPVVGVDVHSVLVTPGTPPVFVPHPHVGFMLDLREYVQAAKAVAGCIAMMIVQDKVTEYIEDHPDDATKLEHLADEANQQVNEPMGGGRLPDFKDDPTVAEGMKLAKETNKIKNRISDDLGSNVGSGGSSGRPIFVNGMMRATAGTHAYHVPGLHFPLGESFAPPPEEVEPSNDGESFMGSKTVLANNDPMSYMALEALSCWSVGMEPLPHNSAHTDRTYPSMPSSVMLPILAGRPVLVGGPPIMNMAAAAKGLFKAFQGSKWAKALADRLNLKSGFLRCNVLKAEPVDATTGEVVVQQRDFRVSGRLPLVWERHYASHGTRCGAVGMGWQTPADIRLELMPHDGAIGVAAYFPDHATAFDALPAGDGWDARAFDWQHGYVLYRDGDRLVLRTRAGIEYGFPLPQRWRQTVDALAGDAWLELRIGCIADLSGNAWVFERDEHGRVERITERTRDGATGRAIECGMRLRAAGALHAGWLSALVLIDADGCVHPLVTYEHDRERNLSAAVDAMTQPHRFEYADGHRMTAHISARGVAFRYSHCVGDDGVWRVDRAWGDEGLFDYCFAYDRARMETRIIDSLGNTSVMQLNARGMPVAEIDPLGGVTSYLYDAQGRANAQTDPAGRTTGWEYDRCGGLLAQTLPDGSSIRTEFDANRRPVCVTLPGGRQWRYEWDARGNLLAQTTPGGATSCYAYDQYGQPVQHAGPRGALTRFEYDRDGNPAARTDAHGNRTRYRCDRRGNLIETIDANGRRSSYEYDRNGNLTRAIEPGGREIHCVYDAEGNLVRYRDAAGYGTQMEYSAFGRLRRRLAPDGSVVEYRYDTEEQLVGVVNERGELYGLERDALGRIVTETDYWGQTRRYRYGPTGELLDSADPLGQTTGYRYDRLGRIVQKRVPDPEQPDGLRIDRFEYDRRGDLVLAQNHCCRVAFRYDDAGRVIEERQGDEFTISSLYDAAGNRTERRTRFAAGADVVEHTVRYAYDARDAVTSIQIDDAAPVLLERDARGHVCAEQLGANLRRELSYEAGGQLASQQTLLADTGVLFASEYAYDANGELVETRDLRGGVERFQYDPMGRVTSHLDPTGRLRHYLHDPAGDLLKTHVHERRSAGAAGATEPGTWVREGEYDGCYHAYDKVGNLIRRQDASQDLTLRWDAAGQLVETVAVRPALAGTAEGQIRIRARYEYDPFQRRVRKIARVERAGGVEPMSLSRISHFFWDGNTRVGEHMRGEDRRGETDLDLYGGTLPDAGCVKEWIYYPETFRPLAVVNCDLAAGGASTKAMGQAALGLEWTYFYQNGPNGAPVRMHDVSGQVIWEGRYRSTGGVENWGGSDQPLRLQGQDFDAESGLHYNRYRYFDPSTGSFINQDPIGLEGGLNLYGYAPATNNWVDPLGLTAGRFDPHNKLPPWGGREATGVHYGSSQDEGLIIVSGMDEHRPAVNKKIDEYSGTLASLMRGASWDVEPKSGLLLPGEGSVASVHINYPGGPCINCRRATPLFMPDNTTLWVWYPKKEGGHSFGHFHGGLEGYGEGFVKEGTPCELRHLHPQ